MDDKELVTIQKEMASLSNLIGNAIKDIERLSSKSTDEHKTSAVDIEGFKSRITNTMELVARTIEAIKMKVESMEVAIKEVDKSAIEDSDLQNLCRDFSDKIKEHERNMKDSHKEVQSALIKEIEATKIGDLADIKISIKVLFWSVLGYLTTAVGAIYLIVRATIPPHVTP